MEYGNYLIIPFFPREMSGNHGRFSGVHVKNIKSEMFLYFKSREKKHKKKYFLHFLWSTCQKAPTHTRTYQAILDSREMWTEEIFFIDSIKHELSRLWM